MGRADDKNSVARRCVSSTIELPTHVPISLGRSVLTGDDQRAGDLFVFAGN